MATRTPLLNYYDVLGLRRDAGPLDIEAAYRSQVLKYRDLPNGAEQTRRANLAYRALSNPERRRDYDAALDGRGAEPLPQRPAVAPPGGSPDPTMAPPPPPPEAVEEGADEQWDEDRRDRPSGATRILMLAVGAGLLALLAILAWGVLSRDAEVAQQGGGTDLAGTTAPSAAAPAAPPAEERSWLEETLADVASLGPEPPTPTLPAESQGGEQSPATNTAEPAAAAPAESEAPAESAASAEESAAPGETESSTTPEPAATTPPEAEAQPAPQPAPPPRPAYVPPPDRTAPARLLGGGLYNSDNVGGRFVGTVGVRIVVSPYGRPASCRVIRSSGNGNLDALTCRLLQQRLTFVPARNRAGVPVASVVESTHIWGRRR